MIPNVVATANDEKRWRGGALVRWGGYDKKVVEDEKKTLFKNRGIVIKDTRFKIVSDDSEYQERNLFFNLSNRSDLLKVKFFKAGGGGVPKIDSCNLLVHFKRVLVKV